MESIPSRVEAVLLHRISDINLMKHKPFIDAVTTTYLQNSPKNRYKTDKQLIRSQMKTTTYWRGWWLRHTFLFPRVNFEPFCLSEFQRVLIVSPQSRRHPTKKKHRNSVRNIKRFEERRREESRDSPWNWEDLENRSTEESRDRGIVVCFHRWWWVLIGGGFGSFLCPGEHKNGDGRWVVEYRWWRIHVEDQWWV